MLGGEILYLKFLYKDNRFMVMAPDLPIKIIGLRPGRKFMKFYVQLIVRVTLYPSKYYVIKPDGNFL